MQNIKSWPVWCGDDICITDPNITLVFNVALKLKNQELPSVVWWCGFFTDHDTTLWLHWVTLGCGNIFLCQSANLHLFCEGDCYFDCFSGGRTKSRPTIRYFKSMG